MKARATRWLVPLLVAIGAAASGPAWAAEPDPVTADVLVLYTPGVAALYGGATETRIQYLEDVSNDIFRRSEAGLRIRVVHAEERAFSDAESSIEALRAVTRNEGVFADIEALRDLHGADLVVLLRPYAGDGICGVAWLLGYQTNGDLSGYQRYAYSHVSVDCSPYVLSHELGHNMGLLHSRRQDGSGGTFPHALGHGVDGHFATVMAYGSTFGAPKIHLFSHPDLDCEGLPCGVDRADPEQGADAVHVLRHVASQVAAFSPASAETPSTPTIELLVPAPKEKLRAGKRVLLAWTRSEEVAMVDVKVRVESKKGKWRTLAQDLDADGLSFKVPKKWGGKRVRFLLVGSDGTGDPVAADLTGLHPVRKAKK